MEQFDLNDKELALMLYNAYRHNQPIGKDQIPAFLEKDKAYAVQQAVTEKKVTDDHEELVAYKISLTSKGTQDLFNSDSPLYGAMTASALSDETIQLSSMSSPLIEIEVVFVVKEDLSAADDIDDLIEKTAVAPGIEVPDSRFEDWFPNITLGQVIADSAVAGKIVVGKAIDDYTYDQLKEIKGTLTLEGEEIANGPSSEVLGHPLNALKWLVDELNKFDLSLKKGMYVSSGTFILPKPLERGHYEASFENLGSVKLEVR